MSWHVLSIGQELCHIRHKYNEYYYCSLEGNPLNPDSELSHVIDESNPLVFLMYAEAFKCYFQLQSSTQVITQLKRLFSLE